MRNIAGACQISIDIVDGKAKCFALGSHFCKNLNHPAHDFGPLRPRDVGLPPLEIAVVVFNFGVDLLLAKQLGQSFRLKVNLDLGIGGLELSDFLFEVSLWGMLLQS